MNISQPDFLEACLFPESQISEFRSFLAKSRETRILGQGTKEMMVQISIPETMVKYNGDQVFLPKCRTWKTEEERRHPTEEGKLIDFLLKKMVPEEHRLTCAFWLIPGNHRFGRNLDFFGARLTESEVYSVLIITDVDSVWFWGAYGEQYGAIHLQLERPDKGDESAPAKYYGIILPLNAIAEERRMTLPDIRRIIRNCVKKYGTVI